MWGINDDLRKSTINDIKELTAISIKAFGSDIQVCGKEAGGPPDYDSESWYRKMKEQNHLYTFLNSDENIVGGAVLFGAEIKLAAFIHRQNRFDLHKVADFRLCR